MARSLRGEYAGAWFHVSGWGNERKAIFRDERDQERFVSLLGKLEPGYGLEVHGFVLMGNHYHLLLRMREERGLSARMQYLGVSYTGWFNRRHRRSGHLFQGRFKAVVMDFEEWGVKLSRYIHLNPVRTKRHGLDKRARAADREGMGEVPGRKVVKGRLEGLRQHRWNSLQAYCGWQKRPGWLHVEEILAAFGAGVRGYLRYVEEAIRAGQEDSPWENVVGG